MTINWIPFETKNYIGYRSGCGRFEIVRSSGRFRLFDRGKQVCRDTLTVCKERAELLYQETSDMILDAPNRRVGDAACETAAPLSPAEADRIFTNFGEWRQVSEPWLKRS